MKAEGRHDGLVLIVVRFAVPAQESPVESAEAVDQVTAQVAEAAEVLARQPGWVRGEVARSLDSTDEGTSYVTLIAEFVSVGDYRRALSAMDVRLAVVPVLYRAVDEPTAYETLAVIEPGSIRWHTGDLDPGHGEASVGRREPPASPVG